MDTIVVVVAFLMIAFGLLVTGIPLRRKHAESVREIRNCDGTLQHFVFRVRLSEEELFRRLAQLSDADELSCEADRENGRVTLSEYGASAAYRFTLQAEEDALLLRLDQCRPLAQVGNIPWKINLFFQNKLNAELVPFSE